jgi:tight adherence protein C
MSLVTLEMRAGKRRSEALRNFAERTGEPEVRKLMAILIQNDRFGTSMGESLRNHSDFMRTQRRQQAEERAGKVGVKLVFPIFFFYSALDADRRRGSRPFADFQVFVPDDEASPLIHWEN